MSSPRLIAVTTMIPTRTGFAWWACEVDVPASVPVDDNALVEHLRDRLIRDGVLSVTRLHLVDTADRGRKIVTKRRPQLLGKHMVGAIAPMRPFELVEREAEFA